MYLSSVSIIHRSWHVLLTTCNVRTKMMKVKITLVGHFNQQNPFDGTPALDHASSLSRKLAYVPGPTFGFVKLLASSGSHCTK